VGQFGTVAASALSRSGYVSPNASEWKDNQMFLLTTFLKFFPLLIFENFH